MSVLAFLPAIFLGILGGLLGAFFVFLNIRINKIRLWFFSTIQKPSLRKSVKLLESILIFVSNECYFLEHSKDIFIPDSE